MPGRASRRASTFSKIRPDIIKLDRGLITDIDTDLGVRALAAGMVAMAEQIGATVTAEGIETRPN